MRVTAGIILAPDHAFKTAHASSLFPPKLQPLPTPRLLQFAPTPTLSPTMSQSNSGHTPPPLASQSMQACSSDQCASARVLYSLARAPNRRLRHDQSVA